jgi:hypothetical protein
MLILKDWYHNSKGEGNGKGMVEERMIDSNDYIDESFDGDNKYNNSTKPNEKEKGNLE